MNLPSKRFIGEFPVSIGTYQQFIGSFVEEGKKNIGAYVCVANVHMFIEAYDSPEFLNTVKGALIVCPDGMPLTWANKLIHGHSQERVAGMDLMGSLIKECEQHKLSVFFLGTTESLLNSIIEKCRLDYPKLKLAGTYSPPFAPIDKLDINAIAEKINEYKPNVTFVALGCPKQEQLMQKLKPHVSSLMLGVGGAFPVFVGQQSRSPYWMQKAGLEWLYRLAQEPKRLFKRYAYTNTKFIWLVIKIKLFGKTP